jgi:glycosyltransferase involved in cell wall biosynthesis
MALRVLLLTQWFDPEPTIKGLAFARELVRQGHTVEVLTGFPNYPLGRLYPGYRLRVLQREDIDGIRVNRVLLYPSHDQSPVRRAFNYASFALSSLLFGLMVARRADVIYAYHPPLSVGVVAVLLRRLCRRPVVYDIQDMWPDTLRATGMIHSERLLRAVAKLCGWVYRGVDQIVVLSPGFRRILEQRGVPPGKVEMIYNWADETSLHAAGGRLPEGFPPPGRFRIVFAGNMGRAQALDAVLAAAAILQERGSNVTFVMIGGGVEVARLRSIAAERALGNVTFLEPVPMTEIGVVLRSAEALLVHLRRDPLFTVTIPSKTQAYMAVGRPLLLAVEGDAAELVTASGSGVLATPEDATSLADAAQRLACIPRDELEQMGDRAARYYSEHLSIARGTEKFAELFTRLARGHAR